jgi:hypothetical protein
MADGSIKNIQDIKVGDYVESRYESIDKVMPARVTKVYSHTADEMGEYYLIINKDLRVTPNHLVYINKKWIAAGDAKIGDYLLDLSGKQTRITSIEKVYQKSPTYNFEVETPESVQLAYKQTGGKGTLQTSTYFAGSILVNGLKSFNVQQQQQAQQSLTHL